MSLTNESVVVITGASSGIGRALTVRLAQEPIAGIAISDVNAKGSAETEKLMGNPNLRVTTHHVNVADEMEMRIFAEEVVSLHGRVTHVINNAGVALGGSVKEVSLDDMHWLININFWGVVYGTKLFLPYLEKENQHTSLIFLVFSVSSAHQDKQLTLQVSSPFAVLPKRSVTN
jgi:NAD(P)-dependent dehydrogenase (short-subunit alcohol dehydrogenase family)